MKLADNLYVYPEQGMLDSNTYIFTGKPGIIIDPGSSDFLQDKIALFRQDGIAPADIGLIVNTHLHLDHCSANETFKKISGAKIALHPVQEENYHLVVVDGARLFGFEPAEFRWDMRLDSNLLNTGGIEFELIVSPGHSPDCVCFYQRERKILVCGDVIFKMNTGRVDLPGGNADTLKKSIESLSILDVELLLPGHGGAVAGAENIARNYEYIRQEVFQWL
jgi:hydroxyacylglutathione hydrolase